MMATRKPFRLRTVLRYRQQQEERLQGELRRQAQALAEAESSLVRLQDRHTHCLRALRQREQTGVSAAELLTYSAFLEHLSGEISQQTQVLENLHEEVQQSRLRLQHAMKDRKVLENLEERAQTTQKRQALKDEDRMMAEVALRRFTS
jgi:flagellar FliJ protein